MIMRILLFMFLSLACLAQNQRPDTVFCDCNKAREIIINGNKKVGKTIAPPGYGETNEISHRLNKSNVVFEKEHHTAWYRLVMATSGTMVFEIIPNKPSDDYDFVLFKASKTKFCDSLSTHAIKPVRSCISRDREDILGKTGLSNKARKETVKEGIGDAYAKAIKVSKGEVYYLVLDNVYEEGDGHTIQFSFEELVNVTGVIKDENDKPVKAEITLVNQKGDTVAMNQSKADGTYDFYVPLKRNMNYSLNFFNESSFSYSKNIKLNDSTELKHLSVMLPKLKKGSKYSVGNINFYPGETRNLPQSVPAMMNLHKLLTKNKNLRIMIIGHSNGRDLKDEAGIIQFTKDRATTIRDFLVKKGIDKARIEIDGKGDHEMLFALPAATEKQQEQNRRVEIFVIETE